MEAWRKQCLLAYCGYYPYKDIDDDWGNQSRKATEAFQSAYEIKVDGVFGNGTLGRILEVIYNQEEPAADIPVSDKTEPTDKDVNVPTKTGTFWDDSEFFNREEFRCQCKGKYCNGFPEEPEEELIRICNEIRRKLGVPVEIVTAGGSGVRCPVHNANVGGVANSNHLYGKAADLHSEKSPQEMYQVAEAVLGNTGELGLYDWGIHVGVNCKYSRYRG